MSTNASCTLPSSAEHGQEVASPSNDDGSNTTPTDSITINTTSHSPQFGVAPFFPPSQATLRIRTAAGAASASATTNAPSAPSPSVPMSSSLVTASRSATAAATASLSAADGGACSSKVLDKGISTANRLHTALGPQLEGFLQDPEQLDGVRDLNSATAGHIQTASTPSLSLAETAASSLSGTLSTSSETSDGLDKAVPAHESGEHSTAPTMAAQDSGAEFSCNICFDTAISPVLTLCGHLFCWSCLHQWLEAQRQNPLCPVCKAGCGQDKVIPIYGRGREQIDPRTTTPKRPAGQRPEPTRLAQGGFTFGSGQVAFSGTMIPPFMFSPLGIQFGSSHATTIHINTGAQTPANAYVSRMLLMLGVMMLVAILLY